MTCLVMTDFARYAVAEIVAKPCATDSNIREAFAPQGTRLKLVIWEMERLRVTKIQIT